MEYKYAVGDLAFLRHELEAFELYAPNLPFKQWGDLVRMPMPVAVIHRHMDECHGGAQDHYSIGLVSGNAKLSPVNLIPFQEGSDRIKATFKAIADQKPL